MVSQESPQEQQAEKFSQVTGVELITKPENSDYRNVSGALLRMVNAERRLEAAELNPVTGVPNRAAFDKDFDRIVNGSKRRGNTFGLMIIDADGLKRLNDSKDDGWAEGDRLLRTIVNSAAEHSRPTDKIYHIGGDEVALILINGHIPKNPEEQRRIAQRYEGFVNDDIQKAEFSEKQKVGASAGFTAYLPGESAEELLDRAMALMHERKDERKEELGVSFDDARLLPPQ